MSKFIKTTPVTVRLVLKRGLHCLLIANAYNIFNIHVYLKYGVTKKTGT